MTKIQKAVQWLLQKAIGFPVWQGSTTSIPPGGWGSLDWYGRYAKLLEVPAFVGCSRVLGNTIGSVPFHVYREDKSGVRNKATDHSAYPILHESPNAFMTSMELRQFLMLSYCLHGNAYAVIKRIGKRITGLLPLQAQRMHPKMTATGLVYEYTNQDGKPEPYQPEDIVHIKNSTADGVMGMPHVPEQLLQRAVLTAAFGAAFMRNQGLPGVVLESDKPRPKQEDFTERLTRDWQSLYSGDNAGRTAALFDGMKAHVLSITPENGQYIETMKQLDAEFSAVLGVPLNLIAQTDKTATYASAEQFDIQFVKHTIRPLAVSFEQAFNKKLFASEPDVYCEFDLDGLMRGDSKSQAEYFATMVNHGIMTRQQVQNKLNLPVIEYADKLTVQSNMIDLDKLGVLSAEATPGLSQADIRKEIPNLTVTPQIGVLTKEQSAEVAADVARAVNQRRKNIQIVRNHDGMVTGAQIVEG